MSDLALVYLVYYNVSDDVWSSSNIYTMSLMMSDIYTIISLIVSDLAKVSFVYYNVWFSSDIYIKSDYIWSSRGNLS